MSSVSIAEGAMDLCGFVGCLDFNGREIDEILLKKMNDTLSHRGPDSDGYFFEPSIALAFNRLSIIDMNMGQQPMISPDGRYVVVFNGEIYNYIELKRELESEGILFLTSSDTEVLLQSFIRFGQNCIHKLNGMFAFAIWDRYQKVLFFARDRMGIKPFYYYQDRGRFLFASEIKAIIEDSSVQRAPNYEAISDYLKLTYVIGNQTFFKNIFKLMPGQFGTIDLAGNLKISTYWDLHFNYASRSVDEFKADILSVIQDAVRVHCRSDVKIGAYLSGGLDSTVISVLAAQTLQQQLTTFTGKFNEDKYFDESQYSRIVSDMIGARNHEIIPDSKSLFHLPKLIWFMDEPAAGPGLISQFEVSKLAAQHAKVVLGGQGGDEIFGGYSKYFLASGINMENQGFARYLLTRWHTLYRHISQYGAVHTLKQVIHRVNAPLHKHDFSERYFNLCIMNQLPERVYQEQFKQLLDRNDGSYDKFKEIFQKYRDIDPFDRLLYYDLKTYLPSLLHVEDRASMAVSIESRLPLLDYRLVELAATIPPAIKAHKGVPKYIYREAVKEIIPQSIYNRTDKKGFPTPIGYWFRREKKYLETALLNTAAIKRGIFHPETIRMFLRKPHNHTVELWKMLNIELWFKIFIDKKPECYESEQMDGEIRPSLRVYRSCLPRTFGEN